MNCTRNLYLHKCRPSLCLHCWSLSLFWYVCLPFLPSFATELIPLYLPEAALPSEPGWSHGNGLKRANCFCKKSSLFFQCFLLLPPQKPSSDGWEHFPRSFPRGNYGFESRHFFLPLVEQVSVHWAVGSTDIFLPVLFFSFTWFHLVLGSTCCQQSGFPGLGLGVRQGGLVTCGKSLGVL